MNCFGVFFFFFKKKKNFFFKKKKKKKKYFKIGKKVGDSVNVTGKNSI